MNSNNNNNTNIHINNSDNNNNNNNIIKIKKPINYVNQNRGKLYIYAIDK